MRSIVQKQLNAKGKNNEADKQGHEYKCQKQRTIRAFSIHSAILDVFGALSQFGVALSGAMPSQSTQLALLTDSGFNLGVLVEDIMLVEPVGIFSLFFVTSSFIFCIFLLQKMLIFENIKKIIDLVGIEPATSREATVFIVAPSFLKQR